jgi:hypothetical protein
MLHYRRLLALALLLPILATACNGDRNPTNANPGGKSAAAKPPPESPTTGISQIQTMHDELKEDIAIQEARVKGGQPAEARLVRGQLTGIDILIRSTEMAIGLDTRQTVQREHAILRQKESRIIKGRNEAYAEVLEMQRAIDTDTLPAGFTKEEIQDRIGDFKEQARMLEKDWEEVRAAMRKKEELLKLEVIPPQGETLFTKELAELRLTRKRVEALQE